MEKTTLLAFWGIYNIIQMSAIRAVAEIAGNGQALQ